MLDCKDPEFTSLHRHTKIAITYRASICENNLQTSRKKFPQLKIQRRHHNEMGRRGGDVVKSEPTPLGWRLTNGKSITAQRWWGPRPTLGSPAQASCTHTTTRMSGSVKMACPVTPLPKEFLIQWFGLRAENSISHMFPGGAEATGIGLHWGKPLPEHLARAARPAEGNLQACVSPHPPQTKTPSLFCSRDSSFSNKGPGVTEQTTFQNRHSVPAF